MGKISKRDMIMYIINVLSSYYNPCICSLNNRGDEISLEKVHSQFLSYEHLLGKRINQVVQANLVRGSGFGVYNFDERV